jgi:hypothetical protein
MAGMNLEARGLYIPQPLTPSHFTPHSPLRILSLQRHRESSVISDEPPPGTLCRWSLFRWISSPGRKAHFVAGINLHPPPS